MTENNKIYRFFSISSFIIHIVLFVFVLVVSFLPYTTSQNFYECMIGFFGTTGWEAFVPYILMLVLLATCLFSFFAIKNRPIMLFWGAALSLTFFVVALLPYSFEAAFDAFVSPWIGSDGMAEYKIGFKLLCGASYVFYFDIAVLAYLIIDFIISVIKGVPGATKTS